jgi:hypothetical protein
LKKLSQSAKWLQKSTKMITRLFTRSFMLEDIP